MARLTMDLLNVDRDLMEEYPFSGSFYDVRTVNADAELIDQEEREVLVLTTKCDIQQASLLGNAGFKIGSYDIYFPLKEKEEYTSDADKYEDIPVKRGMIFRGHMYGYGVDGVVNGVGASILGGCVVQIKDLSEE